MRAEPSPPPSGASGTALETRIRLASDPMAVRETLRALSGAGILRELPMAERGTAEIVLAEVLNNIVEHAYAGASGQIDLFLCVNQSDLLCQVEDEGRPMPGGVLPAGSPQILADPDNLSEGGFGWSLIRLLSRDLTYDRSGGRNRLRFCLNAR